MLAFTDADCILADRWIELGSVRIRDADLLAGQIDVSLGARPSITGLVDATHFLDQRRYAESGHLAGGNLWVHRRVFDDVGGFDGSLWSGGDTDLGKRATAQGYEIAYAEDLVVTHKHYVRPLGLARKTFRLGFGAGQRHESHVTARLRRGRAYAPGSYISDRLAEAGL